MSGKHYILGTRASALAVLQAKQVAALLGARNGVSVTLKTITTRGDQILDRSLVTVGGKGLFLKEIEDELLAGRIDLAVHSMKDVPYDIPEGLVFAALLERINPHDAFLSNGFASLANLPPGSVVGTSSLRRQVQIRRRRPDLVLRDLRGNVDTRLGKLDRGDYDAIVLAIAGLDRMGLGNRVTEVLDFVPAISQGCIGVECRVDRTDLTGLLNALDHEPTRRAIELERHFARSAGATCQMPVGCFVTNDHERADHFLLRCFGAQNNGEGYWEQVVNAPWDQGEQVIAGLIKGRF